MESPEECKRISVIHSRPSVIFNPSDNSTSEMLDNSDRYESQFSRDYQKESSFPRNRTHEESMPNFNKSDFQGYSPNTSHSQPEDYPPNSCEWNNTLRHNYLMANAERSPQDMAYKMSNNQMNVRPTPYPFIQIQPQKSHGSGLDISTIKENCPSPTNEKYNNPTQSTTNIEFQRSQNLAYLMQTQHENKISSCKPSLSLHPYETLQRSSSETYKQSHQVFPVKEYSQPSTNERYRKLSECTNSSPITTNENSLKMPESPKMIKIECPAEMKEKVGNKPVSNCHVCGDLAIAHMHYGGVCCYSCKAFFRRATQTGKDKKYKCKAAKECLITYTNRRACQYCRFTKCVDIGMKPNWVLSDEQCNIRFRKVRKEKLVNKANEMQREGTNCIEVELVIKEEKTEIVNQGPLMPFTSEETMSIEFMVDSYTRSKETFVFSEENDVLWNKLFNDAQTERKKHDYTTFDLGSLIMTVIKKNIFFVKTNDKFDDLLDADKMVLLQKNMSEMCHLRGAIRFDTKSKNFVWYFSKKDQLQMSFEKGSSGSSNSGGPSLRNALIGKQDMSKFYKDTTSQQIFGIVNKICEIGEKVLLV